jgi:hypothetical protein
VVLSLGAVSPLLADCPVDPGHVDLLAGQLDDQLVIVNDTALEPAYLLRYVEPDDPNYDEYLRDKYVTLHPGYGITSNPSYELTSPYDLRWQRVGFEPALYMYDMFGVRIFEQDGDQQEVNSHGHFWFVIDPEHAPSRIDAQFKLVDLAGHYADSEPFIIKFGTDCWCTGDLDYDSVVNFTDYSAFAVAYGSTIGDVNYDSDADLDGTGTVNFTDFTFFAGAYGMPCE